MNRLSNNQKRVAALRQEFVPRRPWRRTAMPCWIITPVLPVAICSDTVKARHTPWRIAFRQGGAGRPLRHAQVFTRRIRHRRDAARPKSPHPFLWCRPNHPSRPGKQRADFLHCADENFSCCSPRHFHPSLAATQCVGPDHGCPPKT